MQRAEFSENSLAHPPSRAQQGLVRKLSAVLAIQISDRSRPSYEMEGLYAGDVRKTRNLPRRYIHHPRVDLVQQVVWHARSRHYQPTAKEAGDQCFMCYPQYRCVQAPCRPGAP